MISYDDGVAIKQNLASQSSLAGTLRFALSAVPIIANRLTDFSAAGPGVDGSIKPEITAVGGDIYVATQTLDPNGEIYDSSGYALVDGTSFSTPLIAGAAALIKSARPGLTVDQYRSLLINTAAAARTHAGETPGVQQAGAGLLDAAAALHSTVTAYPASLSLANNHTLTIANVGAGPEKFVIAASPRSGDRTPAVAAGTVELAAGAAIDLPVSWELASIAPGTYEGFLTITGTSSGTSVNVPYWYAAASGVPAHLTVLDGITSARRGTVQRQAVLFRVTDVSGLNLTDAQPQATAISGGGVVRAVSSYDSDVPGLFGIDVQLGPAAGTNVFRIQVGDITADITIISL